MKSKMKRFIAATALAVSMVSVSALAAGCVGTSSKPGNSKPSQSSSNSSSSSSSSSTPLALRTLYFRENGATGGSMSVLRLYPGDMVTLAPNAYTRTGYTFKGWATSANGMVMYLDGSNYIMGEEVSYELFAVWQKIEYPITYELNGGVAAENPATYTIEDTFTFASPTKSEYTFAGWYTDPEFENPKSSVSAGEYGELTLYAKWIKNENTVSFDGNGATGGFTAPIQISVGASEALTANGFTRDYYSFAGWATQANGEVVYTDQQEYTMIENGGCTLYAVWVPVEYDITYVLGEGTNDTENPTKYTVESEITFEAPTAPEHYEFVEWRINGVKAEGIALGSHGEITVTAVWKAVEYDITYDLAGGSVATANPTIYTVATDDITLVNPTREGYTFTGWTGTDLSGATQTVTIAKGSTGDRSYVATWAAEEYAITFDFAGGDVNATYPSEYTIETDTFTVENPSRTGYTFAGWTGTGLTSAVQTLTIQKGSTGPRTYTATWTVNEYAIAYDLAGGTVSTANPTKYTIETDTFTLTNPTKAGYVFAGWTGTGLSGATQTVTIAKGSTGARTYTATWITEGFTIAYDLAGGEVSGNPAVYQVTTETITLVNPTREGYTFAGWTGTGLTDKTMNVTIPKGSTGDRSYTANWDLVEYTISYDLAGGSVATANPVTYTITTDSITLVNPTREGYTFAGWTGTDLSGATQTVTIAKGSTGPRTYTATWAAEGFTIAYDLAGGSVATANPATYTITTDSITLVNPTREGYTFTGWTGTGLTDKTMNVTIAKGSTGDRSYTANWDIVEYAINYTLNGGTVESENVTSYTIETATFTLNNPTRTGYIFKGWTGTNLSGATETVTIAKGSTGTRTYTATWEIEEYAITYDLAGGSLNTINPDEYTVETATFTLNNPTKAGYTFAGWTGTNLNAATTSVTIAKGSTGAREYVATWTANTNTLTFNANGGDGVMVAMKIATGTTETLTSNTFTKAGYTFAGWATSENGAVVYANGAEYTMGAANATLYAKWNANTNTLTFNANGGSGEMNAMSIQTDATATLTANAFTKAGYTFAGWATSENGAVVYANGAEYTMGAANATLYAKWNANTNTLTFNANGGSGSMNAMSIKTDETKVLTNNAFTKAGYTFAGWATSANGGVVYEDGVEYTMGTANATLYAVWNIKTYQIEYVLDGGTNGENPGTYTVETDTITFVNPTKNGYDFKGWYIESSFNTQKSGIEKGSTGNVTVYAKWTATVYTITYDLDEGSVATVNPATYTIESNKITLVNPTKAGYTFAGWTGTDLSGATQTVTIEKGSTGNRSYTATWITDGFTISYDLDGGSASGNPAVYQVTTDDITLVNPTREGYTFAGWTGTDLNGATMSVTIPKGSTGNRSYVATWTAKTNTLTFNANSGSGSMSAMSIKTDETKALTNNAFTKAGYTFAGWSTSADGEVVYANGAEYTMGTASEYTLYAVWEVVEYEIEYELNGGTNNGNNLGKYTIEDAITFKNPTKAGYTFAGWYEDSLFNTQKTGIEKGSTEKVTVYAKWEIVEYTITYTLNGGTNGENPGTYTVEDAITFNAPTRAGYTFGGWYADSSFSTEKNGIEKGSTDSVTVYAKWTANTNTLTFNANGGSGSMSAMSIQTAATAKLTANAFTKAGYTFAGWATSVGGEVVYANGANYTMGTANATLYAKWTANTNTLKFNANSGSGEMNAMSIQTDAKATLTANAFTKAGYTFAGWSTSADGEVVYTNGAEYTMGTASEYTLYAVWDVVNYSITYVLNGGTNGENPGTYTIEDTITFKSPEKAGYTFDGWYEDSSFNTQKSGIEKGTTGSVTVYAKWTPITYTIAYTLNGGSASNVVNYTIETATFTLNNPTRAGYTFSGWTGTGLGGATQTVTIAKGSMGNRTYTATWTANDDTAYKVEYYLQNSDGNGYTLAATETLTGTTDTTATANVKTFEHFTYDEDESTISGTITGDGELVLTVYYTRNTYSVSTSGGNASAGGYTQIAGDYRYETSVTVSATTKAGYEFDGWYVGESRVSSNAEYTFTATENVELTPQWNVVEYAITYVLDGGTNGSNPATYTVEDTVTFVAATKNGYTFGGWYSNEACTQAYNAIAMGTTGNKTVYAKWTPITYTIAYTLNGGSATNETSYTIESEAFTLNNPTRTGYTFSGWTGTGLDEATLTVTVAQGSTGNRTYTATWMPITYTIAYTLNGGTVATANATSYNIETATFTLNNPTKEGYTFAGWTGTGLNEATVNVSIAQGSMGNRTYVATWTPIDYTITYNLNNGTASNVANYTIETATFTLNNPTRAGYTFAGWTGTGLDEATLTVSVAQGSKGNRSYVATWTANANTLTFNANGGSGSMNAMSIKTDETKALTNNAFTKTGYTFAGWATSENGAVVYANGANYTMGTASEYTLYAVWDAIEYEIEYVLNNGTNNSGNPATYTIEDAFEFQAPTKAGHEFAGWYSNEACTQAVSGIALGSMGKVTVYAKWTTPTRTVTFKDEATGKVLADAMTYAGEPIVLPTVEKVGYISSGWTDANGNEVSSDAFECSSDVTLYAKWVDATYVYTYYGQYGLDEVRHTVPTGTIITLEELYSDKYLTEEMKTCSIYKSYGGWDTGYFTHWAYESNTSYDTYVMITEDIDTTGLQEVVIVARYGSTSTHNYLSYSNGTYTACPGGLGGVAYDLDTEKNVGSYQATITVKKGAEGEVGIAFNMFMSNDKDQSQEVGDNYYYAAFLPKDHSFVIGYVENGTWGGTVGTNLAYAGYNDVPEFFGSYYGLLGAGVTATFTLRVEVTEGKVDVYVSNLGGETTPEFLVLSYENEALGKDGYSGWGIRAWGAEYTYTNVQYVASKEN